MSHFGARRPKPEKVWLNVYDLNGANETLSNIGLGAYHSGVEVHGVEWTFASGSGIFSHAPKGAQGAVFRERILLGETAATSREIEGIVARLRPDWPGGKYSLIRCNCNHFSDELARAITIGSVGIPLWVNRMSYLGAMCACLLPPALLGEAPVTDGRAGASSRGSSGSGSGAAASGGGGRSLRGGSSSSATATATTTTGAARPAAATGGAGTGFRLGGGSAAAASSAKPSGATSAAGAVEAMAAAARARAAAAAAAGGTVAPSTAARAAVSPAGSGGTAAAAAAAATGSGGGGGGVSAAAISLGVFQDASGDGDDEEADIVAAVQRDVAAAGSGGSGRSGARAAR